MTRFDIEILNKDFYDLFLNSTPLKNKRDRDTKAYETNRFSNVEIRLLDAESIDFYKFLLEVNQRLCTYENEQVTVNKEKNGKVNIWDYLYEKLHIIYGLYLSEKQSNNLNNPYDEFIMRSGLIPRDFEAIKIFFGVLQFNLGVNSSSFYKDSDFLRDIIDHYIALCILRYIDLRSYKPKESIRNRRTKKCTATMVFNKTYAFNKKILSEPALDFDHNMFPNIISSSIESDMNSLLLHGKMLLSDASFKVLEGNDYTDLQSLIAQSQKLYKNLLKQNVDGDYALNEKFLLEQFDEQTCCLPITLLHKWLSTPNVSFEVGRLLSQSSNDVKKSLLLFFMLLSNLPHYMAVSVLKRFNESPTQGLFTNQFFLSGDLFIEDKEVLENIELLNQVLLVFLFDIFPFIDRSIKSIILEAKEEYIEVYKEEAYAILSGQSYREYQEELYRLYNSINGESYYDNDIIQALDKLLNKPLSLYIQQKDGLAIVKGEKDLRNVIYSQLDNKDSFYNMTHQCIIELFRFLYNEYRMYLHTESTYKSGHPVFIEEKEEQSNPQRIGWATDDTRWTEKDAVEQLTDSIYAWVKSTYNIDSLYKWGRQEDERLMDLLKIQDNESALIRGLTKYRYHYKDTFELSEIMKDVKKALTKFFKSIYAILNCEDIEGRLLKKFVLEDEYLKMHMKNSISDTFDQLTFWLYLPYLNDDNINKFLNAVVTCDRHNLRKSYLALYDALEKFLWDLSLYLENSGAEKQDASIRLKDMVLDRLICEPINDRKLFNGRPNINLNLYRFLEDE